MTVGGLAINTRPCFALRKCYVCMLGPSKMPDEVALTAAPRPLLPRAMIATMLLGVMWVVYRYFAGAPGR